MTWKLAKNILRALIIVLIAIILWQYKPAGRTVEEVTVNHTLVVEQIAEIGQLQVTKYTISDVIEYEKHRTWLPNPKAALMVVGEVMACIDLTQVRQEDVYVSGDSISLTLSAPQICTIKIDHTRSKIYDVQYGLWETHILVDEAYREAEKEIHRQAINMGITEESRASTRKLMAPILKFMGFNKVHISFRNTMAEPVHSLK